MILGFSLWGKLSEIALLGFLEQSVHYPSWILTRCFSKVYHLQFGVPSYLSDFGITASLIQSQSISSNWASVKDPTNLHKILWRKNLQSYYNFFSSSDKQSSRMLRNGDLEKKCNAYIFFQYDVENLELNFLFCHSWKKILYITFNIGISDLKSSFAY